MQYILLSTLVAALAIGVIVAIYHYGSLKRRRYHAAQIEVSKKNAIDALDALYARKISITRKDVNSNQGMTADEVEQSKCVLIVDDQPALRMLISEIMQGEGYLVTEAASGEAAMDVFSKQCPDCVMLDLQLPDMNGVEVLWRLRAMYADVPVILMTAYADSIQMEEMQRLGYQYLLEKPFDVLELRNIVRVLITTTPTSQII